MGLDAGWVGEALCGRPSCDVSILRRARRRSQEDREADRRHVTQRGGDTWQAAREIRLFPIFLQ